MKKLFIPFVALFLAVSLGSCDKDIADVDIPLEVSSDEINLDSPPAKKQDYKFNTNSGKIDLFQGELKEYKNYTNKIRKFKATEVIVEIIRVDPQSGVVFSDPSEAVIISSSGKKATINLSGEEITKGKKIVIDSEKLSVINEILNERKEFSYEVTGGFNQNAKAVVKIHFKGKVTVNILK